MSFDRQIPPLAWLTAFEAAARHKSFGSAAAALGTSQPAVSQRIARLEAVLDVALFTRLPTGARLTAEGAALLAGLEQGLGLIESAIAEIRRDRGSRPLTVATDFGFAHFWLVPRLPSFRAVAPGVDVRVITAQSKFDLRREPIDVAVIFGSGEWPGCVAEPLIGEAVLPVCAPRLLEDRPVPRNAQDLLKLPLLHLEAGEEARWLDWRSWFRACGVKVTAAAHSVSINNYSLVVQAALAGQGVALGWRPLIDDLVDRGQLVPALERTVTTDNGYSFVRSRAGRTTKAVQLFRNWLHAELKRASGGSKGS
jgi:putative choline sulfate-utilization transcription factor